MPPPHNQYGGFLNLPPQQFQQLLAGLQAVVAPIAIAPKTPNRRNNKSKKRK